MSQYSFNRRSFLRSASFGIVFLAIGGRKLLAAPAGESPLASVGFWSAPSRRSRFSARSAARLIAGEQLLSGDPRFLRNGVRIGVRSFHRAPAAQARPVSFALDVVYETENGVVPFHAWSYEQTASGVAAAGQRLTFNAPVDALAPLVLVVRRNGMEQQLRFSVNQEEGAIPLRPGVYFIALRESAAEPDVRWAEIVLREGKTPGAAADVLAQLVFGEEQPVPFNYLTISIEAV